MSEYLDRMTPEARESFLLGFRKAQESRSRNARVRYETHPKKCRYCDALIPFEKRQSIFCNHSCAAQYNNRGVCRNSKVRKKCKQCDKPVLSGRRYHCSAKCLNDAQEEKIRSGTASFSSVRNWLRRHIDACQICGITDWNNLPLVLEGDHINGNHTDNRLINVRLICPNCHSQTPTYKNRNKGHGRTSRRKLSYHKGEVNVL